MEEILEWLRKTMVKTHSSIPQEDIIIHYPSLESDLHIFRPPSSISHDSLYHESLDQSTSQARCVHSLDSQDASSNYGHVQGGIIAQQRSRKVKA